MKKKKSGKDDDDPDKSLKGIDARILHEAYQLLMRKYCPEPKKKEQDGNEDCNIGMVGF